MGIRITLKIIQLLLYNVQNPSFALLPIAFYSTIFKQTKNDLMFLLRIINHFILRYVKKNY